MAKRRDGELVQDILEAIARIQRYTEPLGYAAFLQETMVQDAVVRNLEIIGEAAKWLSEDFRN
jgi:uncharacterized protein with HEPN domain